MKFSMFTGVVVSATNPSQPFHRPEREAMVWGELGWLVLTPSAQSRACEVSGRVMTSRGKTGAKVAEIWTLASE